MHKLVTLVLALLSAGVLDGSMASIVAVHFIACKEMISRWNDNFLIIQPIPAASISAAIV
jgi:hypothetical protein